MWKYKVGIFSVVNKNGVEIEQEILKEIDAQVMNIQTEEDFERMLPEIDGLIIADAAITEMTATGGLLIVGIGFDMLGIKKIQVANLLPAIAVAPILIHLFRGL